MKTPKPRDPSAHLRSEGALRQRVVRDKRKQTKGDRARQKAKAKKGMTDGGEDV